jgi:HTH DNA binding domain
MMNRVVVEMPRAEFDVIARVRDIESVETFRVLHHLQFDRRSRGGICRVRFRSPGVRPSYLKGRAGLVKVASLATSAGDAYLAYFEGHPPQIWTRLASASGVHLVWPFDITPEHWRIEIEGTSRQNRSFLTELRKYKLHPRILSIRGAGTLDLHPHDLLGILTPKQKDALLEAYRSGYYDIPRRTDSETLAKSLRRSKSTALEHRRRAEKRLMDEILRG